MLPVIYETGPAGLWPFLIVTLLIGGSAGWTTGKAIAQTWRPVWHIGLYAALLCAAVRFFHFALFAEPLAAPQNVLVDYVLLLVAALLAHRLTRARQMISQYPWLYEPSGVLRWQVRSGR